MSFSAAPTDAVLSAEVPRQLPGPWRLMLLDDGSPTRHLRRLTGSPVAVDLIAMEADQTAHPGAPEEVQELMAPLLRRHPAGLGRKLVEPSGSGLAPARPQPVAGFIPEVIVNKHRNSPVGTVKLLFEPQFTRFRNLAA